MEQVAAIGQIDAAIAAVDSVRAAAQHDDWSDVLPEGAAARAQAVATIERLTPVGSPHRQIVGATEAGTVYWQHQDVCQAAVGVLTALKREIEAGFLVTVTELAHAELFADFLEMADHLLGVGYKDAAAVIAGSTLEGHLRALADKADIPTATAEGHPLKAERLNSDLRGVEVYDKGDQKSVTAWLNLRNDAAHGDYDKYEDGQVRLLVAGVRDFISRLPA
jgi:hypothetical protein